MNYRVESMTQEELDKLRKDAATWEMMYWREDKAWQRRRSSWMRWSFVGWCSSIIMFSVLQGRAIREEELRETLKQSIAQTAECTEKREQAYRILASEEIGPCWGEWKWHPHPRGKSRLETMVESAASSLGQTSPLVGRGERESRP